MQNAGENQRNFRAYGYCDNNNNGCAICKRSTYGLDPNLYGNSHILSEYNSRKFLSI